MGNSSTSINSRHDGPGPSSLEVPIGSHNSEQQWVSK